VFNIPKGRTGVSKLGRLAFLSFSLLGVLQAGAAVSSLRIGSPDVPAASKDSVVVPIFATQLSDAEVKSFTFTVTPPAIGLQWIRIQSLIDGDFLLKIDSTPGARSRTLTFTAKASGFTQSSMQIARLVFQTENPSLPLTLTYEKGFVEGDPAQTIPDGSCRLTSGSASRANVSSDENLDLLDYEAEYQAITGTTSQQRNASQNDFSGKSPTGAMDIAILRRHILGLHPVLLPPTGDTNQAQRKDVTLSLSAPVSLGGGYYRYTISGTKLQGLLAGEFALQFNAAVFSSISAVSFAANGDGNADCRAVLGGEDSWLGNTNQVHLYYVGIEALTAANADLIQLTVKHKSGASGSAFTSLASAYLNEGSLAANIPSKPNGGFKQTAVTTTKPFLKPGRTLLVLPLGIHIPWNGQGATAVLTDARGRTLWRQSIPGSKSNVEIPPALLSNGFALILRSEGASQTIRLSR
jgi:hypothetical protein